MQINHQAFAFTNVSGECSLVEGFHGASLFLCEAFKK